ncbi:MAG: hypothetical protein ACE5LH_02615 [Fidelibacterota bacterium]
MRFPPRYLLLPANTALFRKVLTLAFPVILGNLSRVLFLPMCYLTAVKMNSGILGSWISFGLYITLYAAAMTWKVLKGDWKTVRV